jgi:hypothetical protein
MPANDKVNFHASKLAVVSAASTTTLSAAVPSGATSGPLTVVTPTGTAVSPGDF